MDVRCVSCLSGRAPSASVPVYVFLGRAEALHARVTRGVTSRFSWKRYGCNLASDLYRLADVYLPFFFLTHTPAHRKQKPSRAYLAT